MKSMVIVRPNLKLILLGALLIAVIHNVIVPGHSEVTVTRVSAREPACSAALQRELEGLLDQARTNPSAEIYTRIADCYEQQRNLKQAIRYLRRAQKIGLMQDED